jgi:5-hydroxyisourate hydrolase
VGNGRLTTHVLDTALGKPAAGLVIDLFEIPGGTGRLYIKTATTNADGRVDQPLLTGADFRPGQFELVFHAGDYLRSTGAQLPNPPFLDVIPIRFGIADANGHYHVPLLLSPFSYSTYRGS